MIAFIKSIFYDLSGRIQKMSADLGRRQNASDVPVTFYQKTLYLLSELSRDVNGILASPDIEFEQFASNLLIKYNTLHERYLAIELYRYQAIVHYGTSEIYFNALIARIYKEVGTFQAVPLVAGISNSDNYYWAYPIYDIIAVPFGEERNLLNLPDIFHEMAHLFYGQSVRFFKGQGLIDKMLDDYFAGEIKLIEDENRDRKKIPILRTARDNWKESWIEEFVCDLVATYLTGQAYGWTNFKISMLSTSEKGIFYFSGEHPPDERRMYAVLKMLGKMGYKKEVEPLQEAWGRFLSICSSPKPPLYNTFLPEKVIDQLVETVFQACEDIGLLSYREQTSGGKQPIALLLNQAWEESLCRPKTFSDWECEKIDELNQTFNPPAPPATVATPSAIPISPASMCAS